jgi:hypothetical protein
MRSSQERGRPDEAAGEMRAFLSLMREHQADVQEHQGPIHELLLLAFKELKILDLVKGDKMLIIYVAAEMAKLPNWSGPGVKLPTTS